MSAAPPATTDLMYIACCSWNSPYTNITASLTSHWITTILKLVSETNPSN